MGAFKVLTHFDLNVLADQFARDIKIRPEGVDLISPEYLIVQTPGMKRWLALETARRNTIFTQTNVLLPKQFIMKLGYWLMGTQEKRSVFERDVLPWALYRLIMDGLNKGVDGLNKGMDGLNEGVGELEQLSAYGGDQNKEMRIFSLAEKTADIFDQYMLYRPEWLETWESGKRTFPDLEAEVWQKYLWKKLVSESDVNDILSPSRFNRQLSEKIRNGTEDDRKRLPLCRVFLFGMSILPPQYLDIFSRLGGFIDVTLYLHVPSIYYYGDLQSDRRIQWGRRNQKNPGVANLQHEGGGNRLLGNLGQMGKEFMDLVLDARAELCELYDYEEMPKVESPPAALLKTVQRDILMCSDSAKEPILCEDREWSIRLAPCYGPLREVEVLHDLLLDCFGDDQDLAPSEVLVVTPDIALYGPLVQMVFGDAKRRCGVSIPYSIADQSVLSEDSVARFAQDILTAVTGRFEVSEILPLFEMASELSGMPINMEEQEQLKRWCKNSGIRWGYDRAFRGNLQLPPTEEYTWRYGIDRMLAGYAMDDEDKLPDGIYPAVEVEGDGAELLGRLADFVDSLADLARLSRENHTVDEWKEGVAPLIRRLLAVEEQLEDDDNAAAAAFSRALANIRERTEISATESQKVPFAIFMESIVDDLSQSSSGRGFVSGAVTVAGMIPMRSIPFRVVAMLGMNRGAFPRHTVRPLFDLMSQKPGRPGDRDSLKSDRYIFLETLLSAQDRLIITWSGFNSGDGKGVPPSLLVDEFRAHLNREYCFAGTSEKTVPAGDAVLVKYPLHPFSSRYRSSDANDGNLRTWNQAWFKPTDDRKPRKPMLEWKVRDEPKADDGVIDGNLILKALSDPLKTFLGACRIQHPREGEMIGSTELFKLEKLDEWKLRDAIFVEQLCSDPGAIGQLAARAGIPPGTPGESAIAEERRKVQSRLNAIRTIDANPEFVRYRVDKEVDGGRFRMEIDHLSMKERIALLADLGRVKAKRRLKAWITHLFLNLEKPVDTCLVALDATIRLPAIAQRDVIQHIRELDALATRSRTIPLPFLLDVSWAYIEPGKDGPRTPESSRKQAWVEFEKILGLGYETDYKYDRRVVEAFDHAENWDEAMRRIPPGEDGPGGEDSFKNMAEQVFGPFLKYRMETK
jgi:exodeoxyribonuclease V gamma subunit